MHIHVERDASVCKFWLNPVRLASSSGFRPGETRVIQRIVEANLVEIERKWNEYFGH
jgi:hypothetical protein